MEQLKVKLSYCYGIKKLEHVFDFKNHSACIIYAPNGSMKSSFSKVFKDISENKKPKDLINPHNPTQWSIQNENNEDVDGKNIFVIETEPKAYDSIKRQESLLVNVELEAEYNNTLEQLEKTKKEFLKNVSEYSKSPRKIETLFTQAYKKSPSGFYECLELIKEKVDEASTVDYSDIPYEDFFNNDVMKFLQKKSTIEKISEYIDKYDELVGGSTYFKPGAFDHDNASDVCSNLSSNNFFTAEHSVKLNSGEEVSDSNQLEAIFIEEKEKIFSDDELKKRFSSFNKEISNKNLKAFRRIIQNRKEIIPKLKNISELQIEFWVSYFNKNSQSYYTLINLYNETRERLVEIESSAKEQKTEWEKARDIFKDRFDVPFEVEIKNKIDARLGREVPVRTFRHKDAESDDAITDEITLTNDVLSTGEKRALYILNIIFELRDRADDPETLIVIDDIADSFDYKNKYAIVEYLNDILEEENFKAIILTHNFDFFRTVVSRLYLQYNNGCYVILKNTEGVQLVDAKDCLNLAESWKRKINSTIGDEQNKMIISAIPLVRNLIEFTKSRENSSYQTLTNLLHIKAETSSIEMGKICKIYNQTWGTTLPEDKTKKVLPIIYALADDYTQSNEEGINLEKKIILSIAIRLKTEEFLNLKLSIHGTFPGKTGGKVKKYKKLYPEDENISLFDKVLIMTPENIHFNSFMYEPILDMSDQHLKKLYEAVKILV